MLGPFQAELVSGQQALGKIAQLAIVAKQCLGLKARDARAKRSKGDQSHGNACGAAGLPVGVGIPHQERGLRQASGLLDRQMIGRGIGLAHRQSVGTDERLKKAPHAQASQQKIGQSFRLVGADADPETRIAQPLNRRHRAGVKAAFAVDPLLIGRQKQGVEPINLGLIGPVEARKTQPQHCPPAMKGRHRIGLRVQQITRAEAVQTMIGRSDKIGRSIGQCAVQIEYHRAHNDLAPARLTALRRLKSAERLREGRRTCAPPGHR